MAKQRRFNLSSAGGAEKARTFFQPSYTEALGAA
jgi:hypothetical protein